MSGGGGGRASTKGEAIRWKYGVVSMKSEYCPNSSQMQNKKYGQ